jgi:hypothetical protein
MNGAWFTKSGNYKNPARKTRAGLGENSQQLCNKHYCTALQTTIAPNSSPMDKGCEQEVWN